MNSQSWVRSRSGITTWGAFLLGGPLAVGFWFLISQGPLQEFEIHQYLEHPVSLAELAMFFGALGIFLAKGILYLNEKMAFWRQLVPVWDGQPAPIGDAMLMRDNLEIQPFPVRRTFLGRRVAAVLDFVSSRGAANELDDHLRTLSDNDALTLENSYSLLRFITWAIPILGFLGTVLGITQAIAHVSPEQLEKDLTNVTGGLATAFDTTALALGLTMVLMFFTFVMEKLEQGILEKVDGYVDIHLAHRFERNGVESGQFVEALRQNVGVLLKATDQLVERQAAIWAKSFEKAEAVWANWGTRHQEKMSAALEVGLERTLNAHEQRLVELEQKMVARCQSLFEGLNGLTASLRDIGREHQAVLGKIVEKLTGQAEVLTKLQEGEGQLIRLQGVLHQNLNTLSGAGSFEQAVQSLTAAIHLLTAKQNAAPPPLASRPVQPAPLPSRTLNKNAA